MNIWFNPKQIEAVGDFAKGEKPYAAKLIGLHPKFGFQRQFIGEKTKTGKTEGQFRIIIMRDELHPGDIFEIRCGEEVHFYTVTKCEANPVEITKQAAGSALRAKRTTPAPGNQPEEEHRHKEEDGWKKAEPIPEGFEFTKPAVNSKALADYTDQEIIQECIRRNLK